MGGRILMNQNLSTKLVVAIGIGSAIYGVLGLWGFSIAPNTFIKPALALLTIFGAIFGPIAALLIGLIGHTITDAIAGWGIWWGCYPTLLICPLHQVKKELKDTVMCIFFATKN